MSRAGCSLILPHKQIFRHIWLKKKEKKWKRRNIFMYEKPLLLFFLLQSIRWRWRSRERTSRCRPERGTTSFAALPVADRQPRSSGTRKSSSSSTQRTPWVTNCPFCSFIFPPGVWPHPDLYYWFSFFFFFIANIWNVVQFILFSF